MKYAMLFPTSPTGNAEDTRWAWHLSERAWKEFRNTQVAIEAMAVAGWRLHTFAPSVMIWEREDDTE